MMISLDSIVDGLRSRERTETDTDDQALASSMETIGLLLPILLRPAREAGDDTCPGASAAGSNRTLEIVNGYRRVRAARMLGWTQIEATVRDLADEEALAAQIADNALRKPLHPVDMWQSVRRMMDAGMAEARALGVLGLSQRDLRQVMMLGSLHPDMLRLCRIDMPEPEYLRKIALASRETQARVANDTLTDEDRGDTDGVYWWQIADACEDRRVCRAWAVFNPDEGGIVWEEDLFAEPGAEDQWTTTDLAKFRDLQREAMIAQADADKHTVFIEQDRGTGQWKLPSGFQRDYSAKKRERGMLTALVLQHSGRTDTWFLRKEEKAAARTAMDGAEAPDTVKDDDPPAPPRVTAPAPEPSGINKAGMAILAARQTEAARAALMQHAPRYDSDFLALMVLAFACDNVRVAGIGTAYLKSVARRLVTADGDRRDDLDPGEIESAARDILFEILRFRAEHETIGDDAGEAGRWLARAVGADAELPRFDDAEFLETCGTAVLKQLAAHAQVKWTGTAKAMRGRLEGQSKDWGPDAARFGSAPHG